MIERIERDDVISSCLKMPPDGAGGARVSATSSSTLPSAANLSSAANAVNQANGANAANALSAPGNALQPLLDELDDETPEVAHAVSFEVLQGQLETLQKRCTTPSSLPFPIHWNSRSSKILEKIL